MLSEFRSMMLQLTYRLSFEYTWELYIITYCAVNYKKLFIRMFANYVVSICCLILNVSENNNVLYMHSFI